jgi:hypothetical protein
MSGGCGCGQPVILSSPAAGQRVDVEPVLLCDVLPDGTIAGRALVEAVYDASSGDRVGTRTVDPATGAVYAPQGTLQPCPPPEQCSCEALLLCDTVPGGEQTTADAAVTVTATTPGAGAPGSVMGGPFNAPLTDAQAVWDGSSAVLPATADNGHTYLVGLVDVVPDCGALDPAGSTVLDLGVRIHNDGTGAGCGLWGRFTVWANGVDVIGAPAHLGSLSGGTGIAPGATINPTRTATVSNADLLAGNVYVELNVQTGADTTPDGGGCSPNDPGVGQAYTIDQFTITAEPVAVTGCTAAEGEPVPFLRHICRSCSGAATVRDTTLDGTTVYAVQGVVSVCGAETGCASPTTPVTSVGLCLADGTPIAVTVVRDCEGLVASEGWLNLTSGAWTAGAVPVGTVACGDSRSIQVSGTFCDVDAAGEVVGLVLVEYTYGDDGAISSVRLVDAVTGDTYTPSGTVTVCPADVAQPEQDAVVLCDTATDGTVTEFVRDYRRDENGAIVGHSDYRLEGTAYVPAGTVGVCSSPCLNCETVQLCDVTSGPGAWAMVQGSATPETLPNGITVTWTRTIPAGGVYPEANMRSWLPTAANPTSTLSTSKPAQVRIGVSLAHDQVLTLPAGAEVQSLSPHHTYDPATRVLTADATSTMAGDKSGTGGGAVYITHIYLPRVANAVDFAAAVPGGAVGFDNIEAAPAEPYPFLRTVCRGCDGQITSTTDTELDGTTAYTVTGTVSTCEPTGCQHCETLLLCDDGADAPATITGTAASGGLANGVTWTATNTAGTQAMPPAYNNSDGSWWGLHSFPNPSVAPTKWTFSRPSVVEFSVYLHFNSTDAALNTAQLPAGLEVVDLPTGYSYDASTGVLTRTSDATPPEPCSYVTDPQVETSARFRTANAVTQFTTAPPPNSRIALCGRFFNYWAGAVTVIPSGQFLRTICRGCDGTVASTTDTLLDGTTPYTVLGTPGVCQPPPEAEPEACCQPVQVCIEQDTTQEVEFISNEEHRNDNTVDPVWKWTPDLNAANPTWYDMYQRQYSTAWSVVDSDTARPAWWVSPHPGGASAQGSPALPNEGPSLLNTHWYPRAYFDLPANADPASIQVQATVFNADQIGRAFRLNTGAWQTLPATATHNGDTYTFGPDSIPGAQAGRNFLFLDVEETVGGGAGLMVHLKVFYEVIPETRSWTRMVCCDDTVYYLDEDGQRQDSIPDGWHLATCGGGSGSTTDCAKQVVERCGCDDTDGDGVGDETFTELWAVDPCGGAAPALLGTYLDGDLTQPYTPVAPVECTAADTLPGPVQTGVRNITGVANQQLATEFPGLQSVTLTVLSGFVTVTMSSGANVTIPAGVTMTWSIAKDDDTALDHATFVGTTDAANYLLNWTWK